jgi:hypothetical protein
MSRRSASGRVRRERDVRADLVLYLKGKRPLRPRPRADAEEARPDTPRHSDITRATDRSYFLEKWWRGVEALWKRRTAASRSTRQFAGRDSRR